MKILCTTRAAHHTPESLLAALDELGPEADAFYWRAPSGDLLLGEGLLHAWHLSGEDRFGQTRAALAAAREGFVETAEGTVPRGLRLLGGLAFASAVGEEWANFGAGRWQLFARLRGITDGVAWEQSFSLHDAVAGQPHATFATTTHEAAPYASRLADAVATCRDGGLEKLVVAGWSDADLHPGHRIGGPVAHLNAAFPACTTYALCAGGDWFVGATPELLVAASGERIETVALAGSAPRSGDAATDALRIAALRRSEKDLREHCIVRDDIFVRLGPHASHITMGVSPAVWELPNIFHLRTPITGMLNPGATSLDVAESLHPTPAVCGSPRAAAARRLAADEGGARGWYAGAVGWLDGSGDLELVVALRCALLRGTRARLFAGVGVVAASDVTAELAETSSKLAAMRGALGLTAAEVC